MESDDRVPRISVLMPVYNCDRYLAEAVDSILNQTVSDFEFIIIDDGSTDRTGLILKGYAEKDSRIRVVSQRNGGIVSALNKGLALCRADYVARMDGDDISYPERFALQVDYLDNNADCVIVGGGLMGIDEFGKQLAPYFFARNKITSFRKFPIQVALTVHPLAMIRKPALVELGGYRATFPHAEDYDLFLRIAKYGRLHNLENILFSYRNHQQSVSRQNIELQEMAMAYAELAALHEYRSGSDLIKPNMGFETARYVLGQAFAPWLIETYVEFRIWRRIGGYDTVAAQSRLIGVVKSLLSLNPPTLFSYDYWRLRQRILGRLILNAVNAVKSDRAIQP
jgi:glycosyltransferase involved in cell wall biosynthesis